MAPRPKPRAPEEDEKPQRHPARKSGIGWFLPAVIATVLFGGAAVAILKGKKQPKAEAPVEVAGKPKPFADLPPEKPPVRGGSGSRSTFVAEAPEGLASDANWQKAVKLAAEGEALFEEATEAKALGNTALLNEKGKAAREKLDDAFTMTAEWEEELLEKYGDANAEVRRIVRTRSGWADKLRWLHKSTAR
jgi:hypothetical protein